MACHDLSLPASHAFFPWSFMDGHVCGKVPRSLGRSWACCVARGLASLAVHGQVCGKGPSFLGRSWMGMCVARGLVPLGVHGRVCGKVPCSLGRSWACVWPGALFPWVACLASLACLGFPTHSSGTKGSISPHVPPIYTYCIKSLVTGTDTDFPEDA